MRPTRWKSICWIPVRSLLEPVAVLSAAIPIAEGAIVLHKLIGIPERHLRQKRPSWRLLRVPAPHDLRAMHRRICFFDGPAH